MTTQKICLSKEEGSSQKCFYECIREELVSDELGKYVSYGLRCTCPDGEVLLVSDVSEEKRVVEALARRCNDEGLERIHIYDVIEDILANIP